MSTIGLIDLKMRANSGPFTKDIKKASDSIGGLKNQAASTGSSFSSFTAGLLKMGPAVAAVGAAIGAAAIANGLKNFISSSLESVDATSKMATRLGVTTEALIGLQHAANLSLDDSGAKQFGETLSQMQQAIGDVSMDDEGKAKDILKILGLDAVKMRSQDAIQNFGEIADAISKLDSKAEKLNIAKKLFGGSGQALLPLLEGGAAGLKEFAADADNLGLSFSNIDGVKVEMANDAISRMGAVITGVGQQIAIELAPYIAAAADSLTNMGVQGINVSGWITSAMELVGSGIGIVLDIVHTFGLAWDSLGAMASSAVAGIISVISNLADGLEYVLNLIPGVHVEFGSMLSDMADDASKFASKDWDDFHKKLAAPPPSEGIKQFFDGIRGGADKIAAEMVAAQKPVKDLGDSFTAAALKVGELEDKLKEQIATFGKSSAEVEIHKLKQLGATDEQLAAVKKLSDQLKAKNVIEQNMTPLERYRKEIGELQDLLKTGAIDKNTFDRAAFKTAKDSGLHELKFAGAVDIKSDEARQAVLRHQGLGRNPNLGVEKNTATIAQESKKQTAALQKLVNKDVQDEVVNFV